MSSCVECSRVISVTDKIACSICNNTFHYGCVNLAKKVFTKMNKAAKSTWSCPACNSTDKIDGTSSEDDAHDADGALEKQEFDPFLPTKKLESGEGATSGSQDIGSSPGIGKTFHDQPKVASQATPNVSEVSINSVMLEIKRLANQLTQMESIPGDLKVIRNEIVGMKTSFNDLKTAFDEINKTMQSLSDRITKTESRLTELENSKKDQANALQVHLDKLESERQETEQFSRIKNVEIKGVPQTKNENLLDLVSAVGKRIGYPILKPQIDFVTRVQSRDPNQIKPIIVCFVNRYVKEDFVAAARAMAKTTPISSVDLGVAGKNSTVYVNDHLTVANKALLNKVRKITKEQGFQYVWVKFCKILIRRDDTSPIMCIRTEKDLSKIV
ncbi:hypothetical protein O0L34_g12046 [Tuta absoluta]|nr:hypothetical protein O0L34_g12046 [Tuta absoluta]